MKKQTQARVKCNQKAALPQSQIAPSPIRKTPDAHKVEAKAEREAFRKRVESMTNDQLVDFIRKPLYHPSAAIYLRALINSCYDAEFGVRPDDALRMLSQVSEETEDKRPPAEKALSQLVDAKSNIETSCAQVEALALATVALIRDFREGKIELIRPEWVESGLRHSWQSLVDFIDCGVSQINSAIKLLSGPAT